MKAIEFEQATKLDGKTKRVKHVLRAVGKLDYCAGLAGDYNIVVKVDGKLKPVRYVRKLLDGVIILTV